jgi:hypothetical protein
MRIPAKQTHFLASLLVAGAAVFALVALPATSHASATGIEYWTARGGGTLSLPGGVGLPIPGGQLVHSIHGKGYHVDWDGANFAALGNLCDTSMRFTYGNGARHLDGNVHKGCSPVGQWKYKVDQKEPGGSACAELWAKNWKVLVAKQCHYVHNSGSFSLTSWL